MALTRSELLTAIEAASDADELRNLTMQLQAVNSARDMSYRSLENLLRTLEIIDRMQTQDADILSVRGTLITAMSGLKTEIANMG